MDWDRGGYVQVFLTPTIYISYISLPNNLVFMRVKIHSMYCFTSIRLGVDWDRGGYVQVFLPLSMS